MPLEKPTVDETYGMVMYFVEGHLLEGCAIVRVHCDQMGANIERRAAHLPIVARHTYSTFRYVRINSHLLLKFPKQHFTRTGGDAHHRHRGCRALTERVPPLLPLPIFPKPMRQYTGGKNKRKKPPASATFALYLVSTRPFQAAPT